MRRIIVGMSGASGVIYGIRLLEVLRDMKQETHLVMSEAAKRNILIETDYLVEEVEGIASHVHDTRDLAAPISSGSFRTDGMATTICSSGRLM